MTAAEGPAAPLPSTTRPSRDPEAFSELIDGELPALCPYLATPEGTWRSARAVREHRCMAVSPPVPLAPEKQRRLCLVDAHVGCATYGAAMAARPDPPARPTGHTRPIARMTPVILDQGRLDIRLPALPSDRASQAVLVGLLGVAFTAILLARPSDPAGSGPLVVDGSPSSSGTAAPSDGAGAEPTDPPTTPIASDDPPATSAPSAPAVSNDPGSAASPGVASPDPTLSGETYRVRSGDTLTAIAARFGTTTRVLVRLNDIADPSALKVGQILILP